MFLKQLELKNFKNYSSAHFELESHLVAVVGKNGSGKTNFLDAIHVMALGKSALNSQDVQLIHQNTTFFRTAGLFQDDDRELQVEVKLEQGKRKRLGVNGAETLKLSEHIGTISVVMITPYDQSIVLGASDERRRYLDTTIGQVDRTYLKHLQSYQRTLTQRNALLKQALKSGRLDELLLDQYDQQLIEWAHPIFERRKSIIDELSVLIDRTYKAFQLDAETVRCNYVSQLVDADMKQLLDENREKDRILGRTSSGIHRDDLDVLLGDHSMRKFGSQGQQKTITLALKLAQYHFIRSQVNHTPILMIDDIFDKLDEHRRKMLVKTVCGKEYGQVFVTHTSRDEIESAFNNNSNSLQIIALS